MLTRDQKIYLIKKVNCHVAVRERIGPLIGYFETFPIMPSEETIIEISDFTYISPNMVKKLAEETLLILSLAGKERKS
jgi:hypothetical protein